MSGDNDLERECLRVERRWLVETRESHDGLNKSMFLRIIFFVLLMLPTLCRSSWAEPCGLRGYDGGTKIVEIDCQTAADFANTPSSLRVRLPSGAIRGILLVDPGTVAAPNPAASKFRIHYTKSTGPVISAIAKVRPGISSCEELQMIGFHPDYPITGKNYELAQDIDCSATNPANWSNPLYANKLWQVGYSVRYGGKGFNGKTDVPRTTGYDDDLPDLGDLGEKGFHPLGGGDIHPEMRTPFSGTFDGKGYKITGLTINRPEESRIGLFGSSQGATISNVMLEGGSFIGNHITGGLVGYASSVTIENCSATGNVSGGNYVGGLVALGDYSSVRNSYAKGNVGGNYQVGGLVGSFGFSSKITNSYATGTAGGNMFVGGLVGATGDVMVGGEPRVSITNSYATGNASANAFAGGLVGDNYANITNSFATGEASGPSGYAGGLNGRQASGTLTNCWWYNGVNSEDAMKAALAANFQGTGSGTGGKVYWVNGVIGSTTAWDFVNTWTSVAGALPHLKCPAGKTWDSTSGVCV